VKLEVFSLTYILTCLLTSEISLILHAVSQHQSLHTLKDWTGGIQLADQKQCGCRVRPPVYLALSSGQL